MILFVNCMPRAASSLLDELEDRLVAAGEPAQLLLYGISDKAHDGFIAIRATDFPPSIIDFLRQDDEVTDLVLVNDEQEESGDAE